ncbi:MAG: CBS domain-containing protein, partial [Pedobacter sp.]
ADKMFIGLLYVEDLLRNSVNINLQTEIKVNELMQSAPETINVNAELKDVLQKMEKENVWILPVVDNDSKYLGFISKTSIFNKYRSMLVRQADYMN